MARYWIISGLIIGLVALAVFLLLPGAALERLCEPDEVCIREWAAATSGWAAVAAAIPTVLFLSKQVRDADRHQRTSFAIQLRRQQILAKWVQALAYISLDQIELLEKRAGAGQEPNIMTWPPDTVQELVHHLRGTSIAAFESEIAFPIGLNAWITATIIQRAYEGNDPPGYSGAAATKMFFKNLKQQADEYLAEVNQITRAA